MTPEKLAEFCAHASGFYTGLMRAFEKFVINTPIRQSMFLAQCAHESGAFKYVTENLNYSAEGLRRTFPKYFPTDTLAASYARKPASIASRVYANRMGNGSEVSGEGWLYHGRGLIQLTGRDNYSLCSRGLFGDESLLLHPDQLTEPNYACLSAGWFWKTRGLNELSESNDEAALLAVTKRVNGGVNGLDDRREWWHRAKRILDA